MKSTITPQNPLPILIFLLAGLSLWTCDNDKLILEENHLAIQNDQPIEGVKKWARMDLDYTLYMNLEEPEGYRYIIYKALSLVRNTPVDSPSFHYELEELNTIYQYEKLAEGVVTDLSVSEDGYPYIDFKHFYHTDHVNLADFGLGQVPVRGGPKLPVIRKHKIGSAVHANIDWLYLSYNNLGDKAPSFAFQDIGMIVYKLDASVAGSMSETGKARYSFDLESFLLSEDYQDYVARNRSKPLSGTKLLAHIYK